MVTHAVANVRQSLLSAPLADTYQVLPGAPRGMLLRVVLDEVDKVDGANAVITGFTDKGKKSGS